MLEAALEVFWILWDCTLGLFATFLLLFKSGYQVRWGKLKLPPGTMGPPVIGETVEFLAPHPINKPEPFFSKRVKKYGDLFKTSIYGAPAIVTTNVDVSRFILQNEGKLFRAWYPLNLKYTIGEMTCMFRFDEFWRKQRNIVVAFLHKRLKGNIIGNVERNVVEGLSKWNPSELITIAKSAKEASLNMRMKQLFNYNLTKQELKEMLENVTTLVDGSITILLPFPGTKYYSALQARRKVVDKLKWIMEQRRASNAEIDAEERDFLETLQYEGYKVNPIMDITIGLIFGGFYTSASTITMAVKFITDNPEVLEKLRQEHDAIRRTKKEGEELTWQDYSSMNYTLNVILETLRCGNQVPVLYRTALQDIEIGDYVIPKGWNVCSSIFAVHTDPNLFPEPFKFNPSRWESTNTKNFLAFGKGPRICPGSELAKLETSIFLHHLVTKFNWVDMEPMDIIIDGGVKLPNGMVIRVQERE